MSGTPRLSWEEAERILAERAAKKARRGGLTVAPDRSADPSPETVVADRSPDQDVTCGPCGESFPSLLALRMHECPAMPDRPRDAVAWKLRREGERYSLTVGGMSARDVEGVLRMLGLADKLGTTWELLASGQITTIGGKA